jgi:alkaline phosphatase
MTDPETGAPGSRLDGVDLIQKYKDGKAGKKYQYVESKDDLLNINPAETDFLMGLFGPSDVGYLDEQEILNDPSLEDMTRVAIEILSRNPKGFFLFVEGIKQFVSDSAAAYV